MVRYWMMGLVACVSLTLCIPATAKPKAHGKVVKLKYPKLLTHRQIGAMSPRQRTEYMKQVRVALVQMERMQLKLERTVGDRAATNSPLQKLFAQLSWIESAYAEGAHIVGMPVLIETGDGFSFACDKGMVYDNEANICRLPAESSATYFKCTSGTPTLHYVNSKGVKTYTCVTKGAYDLMGNMVGGQALLPEVADKEGVRLTTPGVVKNNDFVSEKEALTYLRGAYDSSAMEKYDRTPAITAADWTGSPVISGVASVGLGATNTDLAVAPVADSVDPSAEPGAQIEAAGGTCEWKSVVCSDANPSANKVMRKAFRKAHDTEFAGKNKSICLFAGNFSTYADNKASSGQCLPPNELGDLKCSRGKEVLCNPVVFGLSGGKPICIPSKGNSTKECAGKVPEPYEPANGIPGESWDEFSKTFEDNFKKYCLPGVEEGKFDSKFQQYFCNECNTVGKTIVSANKDFARKLNLCEAPEATGADDKGKRDGDATPEAPANDDPDAPAVKENDDGRIESA